MLTETFDCGFSRLVEMWLDGLVCVSINALGRMSWGVLDLGPGLAWLAGLWGLGSVWGREQVLRHGTFEFGAPSTYPFHDKVSGVRFQWSGVRSGLLLSADD